MPKGTQVVAFEGGALRSLVSGEAGREAVLALPLNRLIVKMVRVPAGEESQYEPCIKDGSLFGRGASDCLGNAVAVMKAMCSAPAGTSVGCIFAGDEEIGGKTTAYMVSQGYRAEKFGLVMDTCGNIYYEQKKVYTVYNVSHCFVKIGQDEQKHNLLHGVNDHPQNHSRVCFKR